jgi:Family of unknown function (DUF5696)
MRDTSDATPGPQGVLKQLENDFLNVVIHADASLEITDKRRGEVWRSGPVAIQEEGPIDEGSVFARTDRTICEQYPGRFAGTVDGAPDGEQLRFQLIGRQGEVMGGLLCDLTLERDELVLRLVEIDDAIPSLFFPPPLFSESVVLPERTGKWFRHIPERSVWQRTLYKLHQHISMRWYGGLRGDNGWMCIFEDGWADSCVMKFNLTLTAGWLKSLGRWTPRSVRYCFTDNGYVGMAKRYRTWAKSHGLFHSLAEKLEHLPHLANLIGGRTASMFFADARRTERDLEDDVIDPTADTCVSTHFGRATVDVRATLDGPVVIHKFRDALEHQAAMRKSGMTKGMFNYQGWIRNGYDASHPDVWPPEESLGDIEELRALLAPDPDFIKSLHDNYLDIYEDCPSFPHGVIVRSNGRLMAGGIWSERQCYILNSRDSLAYVKRNWPDISSLGVNGMYIDTLTTMELYESYEPGNTLTREQDFACRQAIVRFFYDNGIVFGSENISEITVMGGSYGNIHHPDARVPGQNIPLFQLVFGDCCLLGISGERLSRIANGAKPTDVDGDWHEQTATSELMCHRFLDEACMVEELEYANGRSVIVNFSEAPFTQNGRTVAANDYLTTAV